MKRLLFLLAFLPLINGGLFFDPDRSEVADSALTSKVITVGTSQVEVFTGSARDAKRQAVFIYNDSNTTLYYGPSGVTTTGSTKGIPLVKGQWITIPLGDVPLFIISGSSGNDIIVQEIK
jgi:hypothetical protein